MHMQCMHVGGGLVGNTGIHIHADSLLYTSFFFFLLYMVFIHVIVRTCMLHLSYVCVHIVGY